MKNIHYLLYIVLLIMISACNKDNIVETDEQLGISKITYYPTFTMNGERYVVLKPGDTFTDPGATAKEGTTDIPVTTTGTVDTSIPGVYTITYSAVNKDGFSSSVMRTVVVATIEASAAAHDLSGEYARTSNGQIATWTKIAPGVYTVFNPGGAEGANLTVVTINAAGYEIDIPEQIASDGSPTSSTDETYNPTTATYSWIIINPGYGAAPRTFVKQ